MTRLRFTLAQLVLLAFAVALPQFAPLAVEDCPRHAVPALATVELGEDTAAIRFVVEVIQQIKRLGYAPKLTDGPTECRGAPTALKAADQLRGTHRAHLQGPATRSRSSQFRAIRGMLIRWRARPLSAP
jgi:hypothetical protein